MRYIISDIHGCYEEYQNLLAKLNFSAEDELYVLGDAMDRGPEPIKVIQDLMQRPNVFYIVGNHDYMMLMTLRRMAVEVTEENCEDYLTADDLMNYMNWMEDGGKITAEQFRALTHSEQQDILDYIAEASLYEELEQGAKQYVLVHAGICNFSEEKELYEYDLADFLFKRADYGRRYYRDNNKYLVTGHTPTALIRAAAQESAGAVSVQGIYPDEQSMIYQGNGHIAIDCGCVFGGWLAAYCIETGACVYVRSRGTSGKLF